MDVIEISLSFERAKFLFLYIAFAMIHEYGCKLSPPWRTEGWFGLVWKTRGGIFAV
jgi:hypothetical protein